MAATWFTREHEFSSERQGNLRLSVQVGTIFSSSVAGKSLGQHGELSVEFSLVNRSVWTRWLLRTKGILTINIWLNRKFLPGGPWPYPFGCLANGSYPNLG